MTTKEMSDFINSLWCWERCTDEEQRKLSEIADYLSSRGNEKSALDNVRSDIKAYTDSQGFINISEYRFNGIIDKYKAESEDKE